MIEICEVLKLGTLDFQTAKAVQDRLANQIAAEARPATLMLLEHPHTFTFGRRGDPENLLWNERELKQHGVEVHWTDRGGDATYHGPGQLVGYPLLPLGPLNVRGRLRQRDFVGYVRKIERVLIRALAGLGLAAGQRAGLTGVWVQPDVASRCVNCPPEARKAPSKLASIGVRIRASGVSQHGFALNVAPDMRYWEGIVACDLPEAPMVSLKQVLHPAPSMEDVVEALLPEFGTVFEYKLIEVGEPAAISGR